MMTRKEKSKQLLRKCFNANEWAFLSMDEGFKKLADGAESIDEVGEVSKTGVVMLLKRDFPEGLQRSAG